MTQLPSPHGRHALIIEDEFLIALDLEATMFKLGFDVCALAPSARKARSLAMNDPPDVALVDALDGIFVTLRRYKHNRHRAHFSKPPGNFNAFAASFKTNIDEGHIGLIVHRK